MGLRLKAKKGPNGRLHLCRRGRQLAKCGCGTGCCYCADYNAKPGEPCFVGIVKADNCGPDACCCGKEWEFGFQATTRIVYQEDVNDSHTARLYFYARFKMQKLDNGACLRLATVIDDRIVVTSDDGTEHPHDPAGILDFSLQSFCRWTPYNALTTINVGAQKYGYAGFNNVLGPFMWGLCSGEYDPQPNLHSEWSSSTTCKGGALAWSGYDHRYEGTHRDYSGSGSWMVKRLDAECCGDGDPGITPVPGLPDLNQPGGNPGAGMGGDCPRCGGVSVGGRCVTCSYCGGCG